MHADPVDAVARIGLDAGGGSGGDPGSGGLTAGLPAHPVPAWLHAGRARPARRSRSRLRRQAEGGRVVDHLQTRPWGASDGQVIDRYGLHWLIGFEGDESD
jgi:hypothetical protein